MDPNRRPATETTVVVDGEVFTVTQRSNGACRYKWESGPNEGYGFSTSPIRTLGPSSGPPPPTTTEEHERKIRSFLEEIDPATGYISED